MKHGEGSYYWKEDALYLDHRFDGIRKRPLFGKIKRDTPEARKKLEKLAADKLKNLVEKKNNEMLFDIDGGYPMYKHMAEFFWDTYWSQKEYFLNGTCSDGSDEAKLRFGVDYLGELRADEIQRSTVKEFRMHLAEIGKSRDWSNSYINRIVAMVGQVFRWCITQEVYCYRKATPEQRKKYGNIDLITDLNGNPVHKLPKLPETPKVTKAISFEQFLTLRELLQGEYCYYALIAAHTGLRKRNILRLRVCEVDQVNGCLRILKHKGNPDGSRDPLVIQMHQDLKWLFRNLKPFSSEFWFSGRFNYRQWRRWTEKVGILGFEPFRGMRTSYTSWRIEEGANVSLLDVVLGHSTPVVTQKYYNQAQVATSQMIPNQRSVLGGG